MSQILCWNYQFTPSEFPESVVFCETQEKIMSYISPTSVIIFHNSLISDRENLYLLILIKISYPGTILICVNGTFHPEFFENIQENALDQYLNRIVIRPFKVEDKNKSIKTALEIITSL